MKKIIILLLIVISDSNSFIQESCEDPIFYLRSMNKMKNFTSKRYVIRFNYQMSESLRESIFSLPLFNEEEKRIIQDAFLESVYIPCDSILDIVSELRARPLGEKNTFEIIQHSKPIYVSDIKAYMFSEYLIKRDDFPGVGGGVNKVLTFQKIDGVWKITDKKVLEYY